MKYALITIATLAIISNVIGLFLLPIGWPSVMVIVSGLFFIGSIWIQPRDEVKH